MLLGVFAGADDGKPKKVMLPVGEVDKIVTRKEGLNCDHLKINM
jgi:hypothetical protein